MIAAALRRTWPVSACALLAAAFLGTLCMAAPAEAPVETTAIRGKAVTVAGAPVAGVRISLASYGIADQESKTWTATSGADGAFRVAVPAEAASHGLSVSVEGPAGGRLAPCGILNEPGVSFSRGERAPMTVVFAPATSRIRGTVTGSGGEPVAGAKVAISLTGQAYRGGFCRRSAVTDKQGTYEIAGLAVGMYSVNSVDPPEGSPLVRLYSWKPGGVRWTDVGTGATAVEDFRLPEAARLRGRVVDETGKAVAGATISCSLDVATEEGPKNMYQMPGQWYGGQAVADAEGRYTTGGMTKETYRVSVQPPAGSALAPALVRGVNVPGSGDAVLQDVTLYKGGRLVGTVVGPDGKPIAGAEVSIPAGPARSEVRRTATTGPTGQFTLANLPTDHYAVTVKPPQGSSSYDHTFGSVPVLSGLAIQQTLKMPEGATVAGTVTGPDGKPVAGATIHVTLGYRPGPRATTGAAGRFRIAGVPPALAPVQGGGQGQEIRLSVLPPETGASLLAASVILKDLAAGKTAESNVPLAMGGVIAGQVKDPDGKPVAAAQVCAFQQMGPNGYQSLSPELTGKDGRYTIRGVPPGNWSLSVAPPTGSRLVLQGLAARAVAAGKAETVDVTLQPGASIVGRVVTDKGRPVAGASVSLQPGRGNLSHMPGMEGHDRDAALTDASGTFRIDGLWPGTHKIQCSAPDPVLRIEPADVKVEGAGEQKTEIVARATGSLRGTVLDAAGKPVGSEFLRLHLEQPAAAAGGQPLQLTLYPSAEGQFRQSHVYAGTYRLVVTVNKKGEEKGLVAPPPAEIEIKEAAETKTEVTIGAK